MFALLNFLAALSFESTVLLYTYNNLQYDQYTKDFKINIPEEFSFRQGEVTGGSQNDPSGWAGSGVHSEIIFPALSRQSGKSTRR